MTDENKIFHVACHNFNLHYRKYPYVIKIDVTSKQQWEKEIDYCLPHVKYEYENQFGKAKMEEVVAQLNTLKTKQPSKNIDIWIFFLIMGDVREWADGDEFGLSTNNDDNEYYSVYDENLNWLYDFDYEKTKLEFEKYLEE